MERSFSIELSQKIGTRVRIRGWLHHFRSLGKVHFLIVRDQKGLSQVVIESREQFQMLRHLKEGTVLSVIGTVHVNDHAQLGVELILPEVTIDVPITEAPPIEYTKVDIPSELEFILDHRALSLRHRKIQAVFCVQAEMVHAYRQYMRTSVEAVEYFAPNLVGASSEGGAEYFQVDYFGHTATLAQSSQLYKQVMVGVNERVFALMPFFRAEKSHTTRHLSEGKQFEFEMGFFDHWHTLMDIQEGVIKAMLRHLETHAQDALACLGVSLVQAPDHIPFPRISFAQAQDIYFERTGVDEREEDDLSPAAEKVLCQYALEKYGTGLIFVTDWKTSKRPFYAYPSEADPTLTNTFDLLCGGVEITSGGQRRHTYEGMLEGILSKGMDPDDFEDYLSIFKYGMPPHGGFGMGLERLTMTLLGLKNIREASLFPSDPKRIASHRIKAKVWYGAENIKNEIIRLLKESGHDCVSVRAEDGVPKIKSLILKGKQSKKNYQFNLLSDAKIDMKRVALIVGEKCEFEAASSIEERFGLSVEAVPPLGHLFNLETFYDDRIAALSEGVCFHPGMSSMLFKINPEFLWARVDATIETFSIY